MKENKIMKIKKIVLRITKCWLIGHYWLDPAGTYTRNTGTGGSGSMPFYCHDCGKLYRFDTPPDPKSGK